MTDTAELDKVMRKSKARKWDTIADLIENDPEWFQDNDVDDADIMEGLRFAATKLRAVK